MDFIQEDAIFEPPATPKKTKKRALNDGESECSPSPNKKPKSSASPRKRNPTVTNLRMPAELGDEDWLRIGKMKADGMNYSMIGEALGIHTQNGALANAHSRYEKKNFAWNEDNTAKLREFIQRALKDAPSQLGIPKSAIIAKMGLAERGLL